MNWELLTDRQREILSLLANGWLLGEVAKKRSTSANCIRMELRDIYSALKIQMGRRHPSYAIFKAWVFGEIELPEWFSKEEYRAETWISQPASIR